jgi:hypothetical protein
MDAVWNGWMNATDTLISKNIWNFHTSPMCKI